MPQNLQYSLRLIQPEDEPFLERVYASTRTDELRLVPWSDEQKAQFCRMQFVAQTRHYQQYYPEARFQILEVDGAQVGRLYVDRGTREILIIDISLLPEHRNRGIGSRVLTDLQEEAVAGGKPLTIHVEKFNPALRLYERLGFRQVEDQGVYFLMRWEEPKDDLS